MPDRKPPTDEFFMENFKKNGGKFLYCSNEEEVLLTFKNIIDENQNFEEEVCCFDQELKTMFENFDLEFTRNGNAPFFLSRCEYLIANTGGILISSNQISEKKLSELPDNFIILANTSQLIDTIGEGMRGINKKQQKIPTNITTIKTFTKNEESDFMSYGNTSKNLYLLLLEDL
ncbi:MAG TPA: LUD domain-containing protein [Flavobacteriaceae bacterium]|nr:LUD domain-containing protein [Flavobacteriaceae bacterium]